MSNVHNINTQPRLKNRYDEDTPNYTGRLLTLNPDSPRRHFQCGGFILGGQLQSNIVPEEAQMLQIHRAILDGILLDVTESGSIATNRANLSGIEEQDTEKRVYIAQDKNGEAVAYGTADPSVIKQFDEALASGTKLVLPEGFGDEEKYLIKTTSEPVAPPVRVPVLKRSLKARIKDRLYRWIQKL